jgi:hypothetical protein
MLFSTIIILCTITYSLVNNEIQIRNCQGKKNFIKYFNNNREN